MTRTHTCIVALIVVGLLAHVGTGHAAAPFSDRSLRGTYGFSGSGTLLGIPATVVGLNSFDRAGGCEIAAQLNLGGIVVPLDVVACFYAVAADGSGTQTLTLAAPPVPVPPEFPAVVTSRFVIVNGADELHFVLSDDVGRTIVASGTSRRQSARSE